jgi:hypothetical protein
VGRYCSDVDREEVERMKKQNGAKKTGEGLRQSESRRKKRKRSELSQSRRGRHYWRNNDNCIHGSKFFVQK